MTFGVGRMSAVGTGGDGLRGEQLRVPHPHGRGGGVGVSALGRLQGRQGGGPLLRLLRTRLPLHIILPDHGGTQDTLGLHESSSYGNINKGIKIFALLLILRPDALAHFIFI